MHIINAHQNTIPSRIYNHIYSFQSPRSNFAQVIRIRTATVAPFLSSTIDKKDVVFTSRLVVFRLTRTHLCKSRRGLRVRFAWHSFHNSLEFRFGTVADHFLLVGAKEPTSALEKRDGKWTRSSSVCFVRVSPNICIRCPCGTADALPGTVNLSLAFTLRSCNLGSSVFKNCIHFDRWFSPAGSSSKC